jgi:hypothetical protein
VNKFKCSIDISDYFKKSDSEKESAFLTRSLAAFAIMHMAGLEPQVAAESVTDGYKDNGIDAIYYDEKENKLYLAQSKWNHEGKGSLAVSDALKVVRGVKDLFRPNYAKFNAKVQAKKEVIDKALLNSDIRVVLLVVYSGHETLNDDIKTELDELIQRMNDDGDEVLTYQVFRQTDIHSIIVSGARGTPLNIEVVLHNWGMTREPYRSFYGQVAASDIAQWDIHHPLLFAPNLRMFLGSTEVNQSLMDTLRNNPKNFWYFNNGITVLCTSIKRKQIGGDQRDSGTFECKGVTVVNGAQTVGAISVTNTNQPKTVAKAMVQVRFISLENCPDNFAHEVTRATNTQNRIERRDFVTLDEQQDRIRSELQLDGITYVYKSGERQPSSESGFDLTDATVALACSSADISLAVQVKREIGKLWEDIHRDPYRRLFNSSVQGIHVWRMVQILRVIDGVLRDEHEKLEKLDGRDAHFAVHGNRFTAHLVYRRLAAQGLYNPESELSVALANARESTVALLSKVIIKTNRLFPDSYLASLFKNLNKCKEVDSAIREQRSRPQRRTNARSRRRR